MGLDRTAKKLSRRQHERDDADVCACGRDLSVGWRGECRDGQVGGVSAGTEWFRVVGTLGVAVSRGELDFDMNAASDGDASIPIPSGSASGIATASAVSAVCSIIGTCALALISSLGSLIVTLTSMAAASQAQSSVAPGCSVSTRD